MPTVQIQTPVGPLDAYYTISTPTNNNAAAINESLPTIILLHPVYVSSALYHPQFSDPRLRRFNLIAVDSRGHGLTGGICGPTWGEVEAADDLHKVMTALQLPPCHLFGMQMGACTALQMSISHPENVASLFLLSPDPPDESADVLAGRQEIVDCWVEGLKDPSKLDELAVGDATFGVRQLGFNLDMTPFLAAMIKYTTPQSIINFGPTRFDSVKKACVGFFAERKPQSRENLEKISCPVLIVHCGDDIAHEYEYIEEMHRRMHDAGVAAETAQIQGAYQFGSVSHPVEVNQLLHDFVLAHIEGLPPPIPESVTSPWEEALIEHGLHDGSESGSDEIFHDA